MAFGILFYVHVLCNFLKVEMFVNGEDCALTSVDKSAGRRGLCGTMFIFKIAGSMADKGCSLESICDTIKEVSKNMGTMGLALGRTFT